MRSLNVRYEATGEKRPPREGEWFYGNGGHPVLAQFTFEATEYPILRQIVEEIPAEIVGQEIIPHVVQ